MAASVQFDTPSQYLTRTTNLPAHSAVSFGAWIKITSYENWLDTFALEGASDGDYLLIESNASGEFGISLKQAYTLLGEFTFWADAHAGWAYIAFAENTAGGMDVYRRYEAEPTLTLLGTIPAASFTPTAVRIAASLNFIADNNGTLRICAAKLWHRKLTQSELLAESNSRTVVDATSLNWANGCSAAGTVEVAESGTGGDFTKVGAPTTANDEPNVFSATTTVSVFPLRRAVPAPGTPRASLRRSGFGQPIPGVSRLGRGHLVAPYVAPIIVVDAPSVTIQPIPQPRTVGYPARRPAPPIPQLGTGRLVATQSSISAVAATVAGAITSDFTAVTAVAQTIAGSAAGSFEADFAAALTVGQNFVATVSGDIAGDFTASATTAQTISSTVSGDITADFSAAANSGVINPVTSTAAGSIDGDFAASVAAGQTFVANAAADVTTDFAAAATVSLSGTVGSTIAGDITGDFSSAATVAQTIQGAAAGAITSDLTAAVAVMAVPPVTSAATGTVTDDFSFAASLTHSVSGDLVIAGTIAADFTASLSVGQALAASSSGSITSDFAATALLQVEIQSTSGAQVANDFSATATLSQSLPLTVAGELSGLFGAAVSLTAANDVAGAIATVIDVDFSAAASVGVIWNLDGAAAIDITADFSAHLLMQTGALFVGATNPGRRLGGSYDTARRKI